MAPSTRPAKTSLRAAAPSGASAPRVSVVIPTYNRAGLVGRAIASVLAQTFADFELIVVDDASPDNTQDVLATITDPRLRVVCLKKNVGLASARNAGIEVARGEWVAFLDDDDEWLPEKLELQLSRVEQSSDPVAAVVYCQVGVQATDGFYPSRRAPPFPEGQVLADIFANRLIIVPSAFMAARSALFAVGGFDETLRHGEDRDIWIRLARAGYHFVALRDTLVTYHVEHRGRLTDDAVAGVRSLVTFRRRWGDLAHEQLGAQAFAEQMQGRRRMLKRLHNKHVKRLRKRGRRGEAWRYIRSMTPMLPAEPWGAPFVGRAVAVALFGSKAERLARLTQPRAETVAYHALLAQQRGDDAP